MLGRVRRLERSDVSPILNRIGGSLEAWEQFMVSAIEAGRLSKDDGAMIFHSVRRWVGAPYESQHLKETSDELH
jgi:hypothetical protein